MILTDLIIRRMNIDRYSGLLRQDPNDQITALCCTVWRRAMWVGCILLGLTFTACQPAERKVTPEMLHFPQTASGEQSDEDLPQIVFDSIEFRFDTIAIGEKLAHDFHFVNEGRAPLVIDQVRPSCGCTTLKDWPRQPILPGEGGTISVEFNSAGFPGPVEKSVLVSTNGIPRDWYLKIRGFVAGKEAIRKEQRPVEMERVR
jgi:hypothetical protein